MSARIFARNGGCSALSDAVLVLVLAIVWCGWASQSNQRAIGGEQELAQAKDAVADRDPNIADIDWSKTRNENAIAIADRFIDQRPELAIVIGLIDGDHQEVIARGRDSKGRAVDGDAIFEVGGITKTLTGLLLAKLVTTTDLSLETPLEDLLPEEFRSPSVSKITLKQLATHTADFPRLPPDLKNGQHRHDPYAHYDRKRLLDSLRALEVEPSSVSKYSIYGFGTLGEVLAMDHGLTFEELLRERVLSPLALQSASFKRDGVSTPENLIDGYFYSRRTPHWSMQSLAASGGLRLSTHDLLTYLSLMIDPSEEWVDAVDLTLAVQHEAGGTLGQGLAWKALGSPQNRLYWHNGATFGASCSVMVHPNERKAVAVMINTGDYFGKSRLPDKIVSGLIRLKE